MAFKEIQVSSETIRQIYTRFLSDLEPLVPLAKARIEKQEKMEDDFHKAEMAAYREYIKAGGEATWLCPDRYSFWFRGWANHIDSQYSDSKTMLNAVKFTTTFTLTEAQARRMEEIRSGEALSSLQEWLDSPLYQSKSRIPKPETVKKAPAMLDTKPVTTTGGDTGNFWISLSVIFGLAALFIGLIKSCGG